MFDIFYISKCPKEFPQAVKVKSRDEAREKSRTRFCWILDGHNDYSNFDVTWEPVPWEAKQIHVWPSQHQDHGGTELIPKHCWNGDINYREEGIYRPGIPDMLYIDHGNLAFHTGTFPEVSQTTRFINDYLGTLKRAIKKFKDKEFIWVTSSLCDYTGFDFSWHPSEWQQEMLHVFPSNEQKFGDTFYIHVPTFMEKVKGIELLEWYDTICFQDTKVMRHSPSIYLHQYDSQVDAVKSVLFSKIEDTSTFNDPLTLFSNTGIINDIPTINIWRKETRTITPLSRSGNRVIVPKDAFAEIKNELYDYPYLDKQYQNSNEDDPLDIIFLSNSEACADENYGHLLTSVDHKHPGHVKGINGRLRAYQACARQATTDWFFVVYAKLKVNKDFDWNWQPDRLQVPKHYIFYAHNPVTGDTYGHMAMIAFNKNLVLEHDGEGVDFSMHQAHEVVPLLSGEANYIDDPWDEWRTAFREVVKLSASDDPDAKDRVERWLNASSEWTQKGAADALSFYYDNPDKVRLTYEWDWLAEFFDKKYSIS